MIVYCIPSPFTHHNAIKSYMKVENSQDRIQEAKIKENVKPKSGCCHDNYSKSSLSQWKCYNNKEIS